MRKIVLIVLSCFALNAMASSPNENQAAQVFKFPKRVESIQATLSPGDSSQHFFQFTVDFKEKNVRALFEEYLDQSGQEIRERCSFVAPLKKTDAQKVQVALNGARYCKQKGTEGSVSDSLYYETLDIYTKNPPNPYFEGQGIFLDKYFDPAEGEHRYICEGQEDLYSVMQAIANREQPGNCPASYRMLFEGWDD